MNIKLQAFNTSDKEMYGDGVAKQLLYRESIGEPMPEHWKIRMSSTMMDKDKKDIYSGDVVEWNRGYADDSVYDLWPSKPYVCEFINGKFVLRCFPKKNKGGYILSFDGNEGGVNKALTVIGNIYENPELIPE